MRPEDFEDAEAPLPGIEFKGGAEALRPYVGKVVAIVDGEVRAAGADWNECIDAAVAANLSDPLFMYLPTAAFIGGFGG